MGTAKGVKARSPAPHVCEPLSGRVATPRRLLPEPHAWACEHPGDRRHIRAVAASEPQGRARRPRRHSDAPRCNQSATKRV